MTDRQSSLSGIQAVRALLLLAISVGFTFLVVHYSACHGKLLMPPMFDDVVYMKDGLLRLDRFYQGGFAGLLLQYLHQPPHSPFSTSLAVLAYSVFGVHEWAPYAANCIVIIMLLAFSDYLTRGMSPWARIACSLFVLTVPISAQAVYEFRPDIPAGLLNTMAVMLLLERPLVTMSKRRTFTIGVLIGASMWSKTSVFPTTIGLTGLTLCIVTLRDHLLNAIKTAPELIRSWAMILLPAILLPLPHYVLSRAEIIYYLTTNSLGQNREFWKLHANWPTQLAYFSWGTGGEVMLGRHLFILGAVLIVGALALLVRGRRDQVALGLCWSVITLAAYVAPSANEVKTQFLATPFDFLLIFAVLATIRALTLGHLGLHSPWWGRLLLAFALVLGVWAFKWPANLGYANSPTVMMRRQCADGIYGSLRQHHSGGCPKVLVAVFGPCVNSDLFGYLAARDSMAGLPGFEFISNAIAPDMEGLEKSLDSYDFAVVGDPGNPEDDPAFPIIRQLPRTVALIRSRRDFCLIASCPAAGGKSYYVYQRMENPLAIPPGTPSSLPDLPAAPPPGRF